MDKSKGKKWLVFRYLDWIDNHHSESVRRISHSIIATLIAALIILVIKEICDLTIWLLQSNEDTLSHISKEVLVYLKLIANAPVSDGFLAFIGLAAIINIFVLIKRIKKRTPAIKVYDTLAKMKFDKEVFVKLNKIIDERRINNICNSIMSNRIYSSDEMDVLVTVVIFGNQIENEFMTVSIKADFDAFHHSLFEFINTVKSVFFAIDQAIPPEYTEGYNYRYALQPELKNYPPSSEQRKIYEADYKAVVRDGDKALKDYQKFRRAIKEKFYM